MIIVIIIIIIIIIIVIVVVVVIVIVIIIIIIIIIITVKWFWDQIWLLWIKKTSQTRKLNYSQMFQRTFNGFTILVTKC